MENLQLQLKLAIQNHQIIVAKMKNDPQNSSLKKKLRDLQAEILQLSEKQKQVVQRLRKELENAGTTPATAAAPTLSTPISGAQSRLITLNSGIQSQSLSLRVEKPITAVPIAAQQILHQVVPSLVSNLVAASSQSQPKKCEPRFPAPVLVVPSPARTDGQSSVVSSSTAATNSAPLKPPPIRVPQYPPPYTNTTSSSSTRQTASPNGSVTSTVDTSVDRKVQRSFTKLTSPKKEEPTKLNFMNALGLVNKEVFNELHSKRIERKRRTTANPHFSNAALEAKRRNAALLKKDGKKTRGRPRLPAIEIPPSSPTVANSPDTPPSNQSPRSTCQTNTPPFTKPAPTLPKPIEPSSPLNSPTLSTTLAEKSPNLLSRSPPPVEVKNIPPTPSPPDFRSQSPPGFRSQSPPLVSSVSEPPCESLEVKKEEGAVHLPLAATLIVPHVPSPITKSSENKVPIKQQPMNGFTKNVFQRNGGILTEVVLCGLCHLRVGTGDSVLCVVCSRPHHSRCVSRPPHTSSGAWTCHKCTMTTPNAHPPPPQKNQWKKDEAKAAIKATKEELKKELIKRSRELSRERARLEEKFHQLKDSAAGHYERQFQLMSIEKRNQESLERFHTAVNLVRQS